ncbi:unnamed protein product [Taenia asiatica]|uniref:Uncharacterized protein n=1 Tax=Taenia asiatica TaxID=60517 RepID=A0A0R3VZ36_TAEAS|nr:unnamed protein product [Taenia asiatica]
MSRLLLHPVCPKWLPFNYSFESFLARVQPSQCYASLFSLTRREMGAKNVVEPTIDSGDAGSIQHPPRRTPPPLVGEVNGQFE